MGHLKTPLKFDAFIDENGGVLISATNEVIMECTSKGWDDITPAIKDIVQAVNSHQAMKEALEQIARAKGPASINDGCIVFEDGTYLNVGLVVAKANGGTSE